MSNADVEHDDEHQVTPLELFFDLVFVFAFTQVTSHMAADPTWGGVLRGLLVLTALWSAWTAYAWLTSTLDVDDSGSPTSSCACCTSSSRRSSVATTRTDAVRCPRFVPTAMLGASLIVIAGFARIPVSVAIPALAALAVVGAVCSGVVAYEVLRHREHRLQIRYRELAA